MAGLQNVDDVCMTIKNAISQCVSHMPSVISTGMKQWLLV